MSAVHIRDSGIPATRGLFHYVGMNSTEPVVALGAAPSADDLNDVQLRGRLSAPAEIRELPSGDHMATWRLVVGRPAEIRGSVDTIDCVSTRPRVIRSMSAAVPGQRLELAGALRRRFWKTSFGLQSRYAVDVVTVRRVRSGR